MTDKDAQKEKEKTDAKKHISTSVDRPVPNWGNDPTKDKDGYPKR